MNWVYCWYII